MFHYNDVKKQCFSETAGDRFDFNMKILKEKAYGVHLNSKITGNEGMSTRKLREGTICSHLLNSHCVYVIDSPIRPVGSIFWVVRPPVKAVCRKRVI